jgi:hypothetical protein
LKRTLNLESKVLKYAGVARQQHSVSCQNVDWRK